MNMVNLSAVSEISPTAIPKNVIKKGIPTEILRDQQAFANYQILIKDLKNSSYKAPPFLLASGDGTLTPKTITYQTDLYSANILARNDVNTSWISAYNIAENYSISYFDGTALLKRFTLNALTGVAYLRSLELRLGNSDNAHALVQQSFGYALNSNVNELSWYRHNIRTTHSFSNAEQNSLDFYLWDKDNDDKLEMGSKHVAKLTGKGDLELIAGTHIDGGLSVAVDSSNELALAVSGKGVLYYNDSTGKYRYSENGGAFKNLGGGGGSGKIESCNYAMTAPYRKLEGKEAVGIKLFIEKATSLSAIYAHFRDESGSGNNACTVIVYVGIQPIAGADNYIYQFNKVRTTSNNSIIGRYGNNMVRVALDSALIIPANTWICIVLYNHTDYENSSASFMVGINNAAAISDAETHQFPQFAFTSFDAPSVLDLSAYGTGYGTGGVDRYRSAVIPYISLETE